MKKGPVGEPKVITGENDLFDQFGQPYDTDKQYETWMVASSYLAYGGSLSVIRADDDELKMHFLDLLVEHYLPSSFAKLKALNIIRN